MEECYEIITNRRYSHLMAALPFKTVLYNTVIITDRFFTSPFSAKN